jgi:hypothetical protein
MRDFYENIGWYNLEPIPEIISMDFKMKSPELNARNFPSYTGDKDMRTIVGYYPPSCNRSVTIKTLSANGYRAQWFDPSNGHYTTIDEDVRPVNGCWTAPRKTSMDDAVLVLTAK